MLVPDKRACIKIEQTKRKNAFVATYHSNMHNIIRNCRSGRNVKMVLFHFISFRTNWSRILSLVLSFSCTVWNHKGAWILSSLAQLWWWFCVNMHKLWIVACSLCVYSSWAGFQSHKHETQVWVPACLLFVLQCMDAYFLHIGIIHNTEAIRNYSLGFSNKTWITQCYL